MQRTQATQCESKPLRRRRAPQNRTMHTHHIPFVAGLLASLILKFVDSQVPSACKAVSLKGTQLERKEKTRSWREGRGSARKQPLGRAAPHSRKSTDTVAECTGTLNDRVFESGRS